MIEQPETEQPEACEGCATPAVTYDPEGVPLCKECAELPNIQAETPL